MSRACCSALTVLVLLALRTPSLGAQLPEERLRGSATPILAVVGVDVIPMDRPGVLRDHTVVVEDGVITRVGPAGAVAVPEGARVLDGEGRYLLPGLADMHAHPSWLGELDLYLASGVTLARSMKGEIWHLTARDRIAQGRWTGPRLVLGGPILEGTPPPDLADVIPTDDKVLVDDSVAAADLVGVQAEWGFDFVKVYNNLPAPAYAGIVAEARARGVPVAGHVPFAVGLEGVIDAGQVSVEHLRGYVQLAVSGDAPDQPGTDFRSRLVAWQHADEGRLRELAERTAEAGIWNTPTLIVGLWLLPEERVPEMHARPGWTSCIWASWHDMATIRRSIPYLSNMSEADFGAATRGVERKKRLVRLLHEAGAGLLAGTDFPPAGFSLSWELTEMVDAGLSPWDALLTATRNPARFLGEDERWGTVTEGKLGNLVLLDDDPMADIGNIRSVVAVAVNGRLVEADELREIEEDACRAVREAS